MRKFRPDEEQNIKTLTEYSVELTAIEPTSTGLDKSILDATGPVRNYLREKGLHDYSTQPQGQTDKVFIKSYFIYPKDLKKSIASLYRPVTKRGDPRIWFKGLSGYCDPNDILGVIVFNNELYVLNLTKYDFKHIIESSHPFASVIKQIRDESNLIADELLSLLIEIAKRGPIQSLLNADTGVGRTLEFLLGININSSKLPDYKGIELKSFRADRDNRKTLFAKVPNWPISKFKSSAEILNSFGYWRDGEFKLNCTVSAFSRNSQGLKLKVDTHQSLLIENSDNSSIGDFCNWTLDDLHEILLKKHNETFWISANPTIIDGNEYFHFTKVEHTKKPIISQFDILLDQGLITIDHLIKRTSTGGVSERGPLFKIERKSLNLLFPPSKLYSLI